MLIHLEEQPPANRPGAILTGATPLVRDVAQEGGREALERLHDAHERHEDHVTSQSREALASRLQRLAPVEGTLFTEPTSWLAFIAKETDGADLRP